MGNYLKNSFCQQLNIDPASVYHACVSQCYDKKLEAVRDSITNPNDKIIAEVDIVLSTTEVVDLINQHNVNFAELPETNEIGPHTESTRISDAQFGPSHGFLDLSLKFAAKEFYGIDVDLTKIVYTKGINNEIWETELSVSGQVVFKMARAYGFRNIQNIMRQVKRKNCKYDFVELLACPGGCTNGGGQIKPTQNQNVKELLTLVNEAYNSQSTPVQNPLANQFVADYYTKMPEVDTQKKHLHTTYHVVQPVKTSHLASSQIKW
jgi:iron only hydrogenase large subunit-like protein